MIDNITLTIDDFKGNFDNCIGKKELKYDYKYILKSHNAKNPNTLRIRKRKDSNRVIIKNSLRRWYFGNTYVDDFVPESFKEMLVLLASKLNTSLDNLYEARISQCEIGMNFRSRISNKELISTLELCKNVKKGKRYPGETVYYMGAAKKIIVYDKVKEIYKNQYRECDNAKELKAKNIQPQRIAMALEKHGIYFTRIEYTLTDSQSFKQQGLGHIKNLGGLANNYKSLYEFFCKEVNFFRIIKASNIEVNDNMTEKEKKIIQGVKKQGLEGYINKIVSSCKSSTKNGFAKMKSEKRKEIIEVVAKYSVRTLMKFKVDIFNRFLKLHKQDNQIPMNRIVRTLFVEKEKQKRISTKEKK